MPEPPQSPETAPLHLQRRRYLLFFREGEGVFDVRAAAHEDACF